MKKILIWILTVVLSTLSFCVSVNAEEAEKKNVSLRIEGISETLYNETLLTDAATVTDLLAVADAGSEAITVTVVSSTYGSYLTDINGEAAGTYGGYDGWMFMVNGEAPASGMDYVSLSDGDEVVFYYAGDNFQIPEADTCKLSEGVITFTSDDTVYDANWNASVVTNPVAGACVRWYYSDTEYSEYVTDENGNITVDSTYLSAGSHKFTVERYADNGMPTALRGTFNAELEKKEEIVATGDYTNTAVWIVAMAVSGMVMLMGTGMKKRNEE